MNRTKTNITTKLRFHKTILTLFSIGIIGFVSWRAGAAASNTAAMAEPTSIALVDVEKALNKLTELEDLNKKLADRVAVRQKNLDSLRTQIDDLNGKLDLLADNDEENRRELRAQIYELSETATARTKVYQSLINIEKGEIIRPLYAKLRDAVKETAQRQGYDIVLFDDRTISVPADTDAKVNMAIQQKRILYADDSVDITDQIIMLMNNKYAAGVN